MSDMSNESYEDRQARFKAEKAVVHGAGRFAQVTESKFYKDIRMAIETAVGAHMPGSLDRHGRLPMGLIVDVLTVLDSKNLRVVPTKPTAAMADASMGALRSHPDAAFGSISTVDKHTWRLQRALDYAPNWKIGFTMAETDDAIARVGRTKNLWRETYMPEKMAQRREESRQVAPEAVPDAPEKAAEAPQEAPKVETDPKWSKTHHSVVRLFSGGKTRKEISDLTGYTYISVCNILRADKARADEVLWETPVA